MGRRKASGADQDRPSRASPATPAPPSPSPDVTLGLLPPVEWDDQSQGLGPIMRHNSLPLVVTCDRRYLPCMGGVNFDFAQPLLLHARRTVRKVVATSVIVSLPSPQSRSQQQQQQAQQHQQQQQQSPKQLQGGQSKQRPPEYSDGRRRESSSAASSSSDPERGAASSTAPHITEVGDHLLIPEDYKGWFAVLGSPDNPQADRVVPHFRQVAQLALSKCQSFLIGGNECVQALHIPQPGALDDKETQLRTLYPGDVLRMGKLYVGESTIRVKKKLFGGKTTMKKEEKFLLCTDDKDREVYLPVENRGTFYVLTTEGGGLPRMPIMRMPDICTHFRFPCVVKLLFGRVPATPCSFTGTLLLQDSQMESSVIGCTMTNLRNVLLDIPIDSDLRFFLASQSRELLTSRAYRNAKAICQEKAQTYMRNMKVAFYFADDDANSTTEAEGEAGGDADAGYAEPAGEEHGSPAATAVKVSPGPARQTSVSDRFRASASTKARPSIVEDQELFRLPETAQAPVTSTPIQLQPLHKNKKSKKGGNQQGGNVHQVGGSGAGNDQNHGGGVAGSLTSPSTGSLRKDLTYCLPEEKAETLSVWSKSSSSLTSLESKRSVHPLAQGTLTDQQQNGGYMSMNETEVEAGSVGRGRQSGLEATPLVPPPKPQPQPRGCNQSEIGVYQKLWEGGSAAPIQGVSPSAKTKQPTASNTCINLHTDPGNLPQPALDTYVGLDPIDPNASEPMTCQPSMDLDDQVPPCCSMRNTASDSPYVNQSSELSPPPLPVKTTQLRASRPNTIEVSGRPARRVPSISFADTYLTLPQFTGTSSSDHPDAATPPSWKSFTDDCPGSESTSPTASLVRSGYLTPVACVPPPLPPFMAEIPPLQAPSSRSMVISPSVTDDQPYETMSNWTSSWQQQPVVCQSMSLSEGYVSMVTLGSSTKDLVEENHQNPYENDSADLKAPRIPPKRPAPIAKLSPQARSPLSSLEATEETRNDPYCGSPRPPPCLTRQNAEDHSEAATIEFANPYSGSDFSSVSHSCEYASRLLSTSMSEPQLPPLPSFYDDVGYVGMHSVTSYTYYDGCQQDHDLSGKTTTCLGALPGHGREEDSKNEIGKSMPQQTGSSPEEEEETLYENVLNLRISHSTSFSQESNGSSEASETRTFGNDSRFLDKLANPPSVFGYVSPAPPRPAQRPKPPVPAAKPTSFFNLKTAKETAAGGAKPRSFNSDSSTGIFLSSPKACKISGVSDTSLSYSCDKEDPANKGTEKESPERNGVVRAFQRTPKGSSGDLTNDGDRRDRLKEARGKQEEKRADVVDPDMLLDSRVGSIDSDTSSRISSDDDLPLGATFASYLSPRPKPALSDSGCALSDVDNERGGRGSHVVSYFSVAQLSEALKSVGLHKDTVEALSLQKVDGRFLLTMDEQELREALPGAKNLDIKKIRMFISGWRPSD